MAHCRQLFASLSRISTSSISFVRPEIARISPLSHQTIRCAATKADNKKKKKQRNTYRQYDLKHADKFALVDAMHYIRAFEVGNDPKSVKYDLAVRLRSLKNGPVIRNRMRLPYPVKTDLRICVIAEPGSKAAQDAIAGGATLVGEDQVFNQIKEGIIDFDRLICHIGSLQKLNKAQLGRILGPKGLMPSAKMGTVVPNISSTLKSMVGGSEFREKMGVVRIAIGQLCFTPDQMQANVKKFMEAVMTNIDALKGGIVKEIHEVVLSSTHSPGFTLNGEYRSPNSISPKEISGPL